METEVRIFEPVHIPGDLTVEEFRGPPTEQDPQGKPFVILRYSGLAGVSYSFIAAEHAEQFCEIVLKIATTLLEQDSGISRLIVPGLDPAEIERIRKDLNGQGGNDGR